MHLSLREISGSLGARRYWLLWLAVLPLVGWALVRVFGLGGSGFAPVMAFTPYAAIGAFLLIGLCIMLHNWAAAIVIAAAFVALAINVLPRTFGGNEELPPNATSLTVLSANIYYSRADPAGLIALVDRLDPDLLSVQELNRSFADKLRRMGIGRTLPESIISIRRGATGAGLFARYPLRRLAGPPQWSPRMPRGEIETPSGQRIKVINVHPFTPTGRHRDDWAAELAALPSTGTEIPWLLVGDFNATLDHAELRQVLDRGYRDAGDATGNGLLPTWPNGRALPPLITIDHVLADRRFGIADFGVEDLPGSDHMAIYARLFMR